MLIFFLTNTICFAVHPDVHIWSPAEKEQLRSLWIGSLPPLPDDPSNAYDTNPKAAALGKKLFFDKRLSVNGKVACATCHIPDQTFTDNLPIAHGIADTTRRSMPLAGMAYSPWFFWDGRADSLWAQALGPIESPEEHGISRTKCAFIIKAFYKKEYEQLFGPMPALKSNLSEIARPAPDNPEIQALWDAMSADDRLAITKLYANLGKSIAAFVRNISVSPSPFDLYAAAILNGDVKQAARHLTPDEAMGLRLFINEAQCINCHNGPLFTNNDFHNVGVPPRQGLEADKGRGKGIGLVLANEFNCLSAYSDAKPSDCTELRFIDNDPQKYQGAFKTPSLRNVARRPPYMHGGQFKTLRDVLQFYQQEARKRKGGEQIVTTDIVHGELSDEDVELLLLFLPTLNSPIIAN